MTNIAKTSVAKVLVAFVAAAMIFTMFAAPVKAQTSVEDLQKMINDLMAQIAALSGTTGNTTGGNCAAIPAPLTIGAQNANVTALQNYLIAAGQSIPAGATGYFGTQTRSALAAWQAANGVAPAAGYYGPITAAAMAAKCVPADGGTTPTTPGTGLQGGEGDIRVEAVIDGPITIDLGKSESVLEFEVEAQDSDISINRVDFEFDARPWLYFDEVNLLVDGREVASLSRSSDFSDIGSGNYRARFSGLDLVVREDDTVDVALELVVLSAMSGNRDAHNVRVDMMTDGIRFVDGAGISSTGGRNANAVVSFDDRFGEGDLTLRLADNSPTAATIILNETSRTNGVEVLVFEIEADDSDVEVQEITVNFGSSTSTVATMVNRARLLADGRVISTKGVTGTSTSILFDRLDYVVREDDTVDFSVEIDFNRGDSFPTPSTFSVVSVDVEAEDADFTTINVPTLTLGADGNHTLIINGIVLNDVSKTTSAVTAQTITDSYGEFRIRYEVTAVGSTVWVPLTTNRGASATVGAAFQMEDSNGVATTTGVTTQSLSRVSGGTVSGGFVRINDGSTAVFELYVTYNPATAGQFRLQLLTTGFNNSSATTPNRVQSATPTEDFETGNQQIAG
ncbi:MAG: peptidoglycan-binding domain-containing protein [Candidatus Paceibacteria bacterium]